MKPSPLVKGRDFSVVLLTGANVPKVRQSANQKDFGERLFSGMYSLMERNFPPQEIETKAQFRQYFHIGPGGDWFVHVAQQDGNVLGAMLFSVLPREKLVIYNLVVTSERVRGRGVAKALVSDMISEAKKSKAEYIIGEIEQPANLANLSEDELEMRNVIRPRFHDEVTGLRAIRLQNGNPLTYKLPSMSALRGEPIDLLFCLRPVVRPDSDGISSRKAAKQLMRFFKGYLQPECQGINPKQVNEFLAQSLCQLAPIVEPAEFEARLPLEPTSDARKISGVLSLIPNEMLDFSKISETWA